MTPDEMNVIIAEWCEPKPTEEVGRRISTYKWESAQGFWWLETYAQDHLSDWKPKQFSTDRNVMALAEKVVKERGLGDDYECDFDYATELSRIVLRDAEKDGYFYAFRFCLATASAPQRAEAMVEMIRALEGER